jgi:hypothetical protein
MFLSHYCEQTRLKTISRLLLKIDHADSCLAASAHFVLEVLFFHVATRMGS